MEAPAPRRLTTSGPAEALGLLELLHPDGRARRSLVLGTAAPASLTPAARPAEPPHTADLVFLAPSADECHTGALGSLVHELAGCLAPQGVGYVLVPPAFRRRAGVLLRSEGLVLERPVAHLPDAATSRYLLPLDPATVSYTARHLLVSRPRAALLLETLGRISGGSTTLAHLLPAVGLVARRPEARPLLDWLHRLDDGGQPGPVVVKQSWRRADGQVVLHRFAPGGTVPVSVAKLARGTTGDGGVSVHSGTDSEGDTGVRSDNAERDALRTLGPAATRAGARVPHVIADAPLHGHRLLVESPVAGRPAATLLGRRPRRLTEIMRMTAAWLERWHAETVTAGCLTSARLRAELIEPADVVIPLLGEDGGRYRERLAAQCAALEGREVPLVAVHGDLTMWNLMVDRDGTLGVVDWEAARPDGLPLTDLFYAMTDAVAAADGYADRVRAFASCFLPGGGYRQPVAELAASVSRRIGIAPELAELASHACWLGHAAREHVAAGPGEPRPFLEIVRRVAAE